MEIKEKEKEKEKEEKEETNDNRLFKGDKLYCEGRERSAIRGWFHLGACVSFFPMLLINYVYIFATVPNINKTSLVVCFTNFLIIYLAHCISAFYHISNLPPQLEIIAQKIDYIGANCYVASSYLPMALLLFPTNIGLSLLAIVGPILGWNIVSIIKSNYSIQQPIFIIIPQLLFFYFIYTYFTSTEFFLNWFGLACLSIGSSFMIYDYSVVKNSKYFNNFEIYHGFSLICLSTICMMNYSIFKRTCVKP
jgi:predicted membrane channel-forming protein YqfA (hemolysin III family)